MKVSLTYFKASGTYYAEGSYITQHNNMDDIWDEIHAMSAHPGLCGRWHYDIVVFGDGDTAYPMLIHMAAEMSK